MIRRNRRNAAPVVDPRADQALINTGRQVRRRLHVHIHRQHQTRDGDRPQQVLQVGLVRVGPFGVGLGAEILHDHFLDVPVARMQVADRQ